MARRSHRLSAVHTTATAHRMSGTDRTPATSMARPSSGGNTIPPSIEVAIT